MIGGLKVIVVLPAYNAAKTLERTISELDRDVVDDVLLVDDASSDETVKVGHDLGLHVVSHSNNLGYGGNQKTCYREALDMGADIVVMVHPDYQYTPKLTPSLAAMIASKEYDVVLASRILGNGALKGGMPLYKYIANRAMTAVENLLLRAKMSEYHTGYRAYSKEVLISLRISELSNDFVFDNQILAQALAAGFRIGEISCPTRYEANSSSIGFSSSVRYGFGVMNVALRYRLHVSGLYRCAYLKPIKFRSAADVGAQ